MDGAGQFRKGAVQRYMEKPSIFPAAELPGEGATREC